MNNRCDNCGYETCICGFYRNSDQEYMEKREEEERQHDVETGPIPEDRYPMD